MADYLEMGSCFLESLHVCHAGCDDLGVCASSKALFRYGEDWKKRAPQAEEAVNIRLFVRYLMSYHNFLPINSTES